MNMLLNMLEYMFRATKSVITGILTCTVAGLEKTRLWPIKKTLSRFPQILGPREKLAVADKKTPGPARPSPAQPSRDRPGSMASLPAREARRKNLVFGAQMQVQQREMRHSGARRTPGNLCI